MQLSFVITTVITALIGTSTAATLDLRAAASKAIVARGVLDECIPSNDCCISTRGACTRQAFNFLENYLVCPRIKICPDYGVPWSSCNADCCSISSKKGRGCPGK
ncbi:hypothetical protein EsH8_VII_000022 [Colletotrichum jinshuiense]